MRIAFTSMNWTKVSMIVDVTGIVTTMNRIVIVGMTVFVRMTVKYVQGIVGIVIT
jgi:hypothetical protein